MKTDLLTDMRYCRDHGDCDKCGHYSHELDCIDDLLLDAVTEIERLRETVEKRDAEIERLRETAENVKIIDAANMRLTMENERLGTENERLQRRARR